MGADVNSLVDELRDAAIALDAAVWGSGLQGRFTSTRRSRSEQVRLYRAYVSGRHPFPVAPPGASAHEYGEAFDYLVSPAQYQEDVGLTWVSWGGEWGGKSDAVHFELPGASARALARSREPVDLYAKAAELNASLPWYVQLLTPWELSLYQAIPESLRYLINPSLPIPAIRILIQSLSNR